MSLGLIESPEPPHWIARPQPQPAPVTFPESDPRPSVAELPLSSWRRIDCKGTLTVALGVVNGVRGNAATRPAVCLRTERPIFYSKSDVCFEQMEVVTICGVRQRRQEI